MPLTCSRCGQEIPKPDANATCPRCGAPQPNPAWTMPFSQGGTPTLESSRSEGGSLAENKKYAIIIVNGIEPGKVVPIEKPRTTLGRVDCDIVIEDPGLSRQHALIAINGVNARLEDLGSTNGTFVDEERIESSELSDRSEFRIGSHQIVFVMRDEDGL